MGESINVTEEVIDLRNKIRGIYQLLEILQTAEEASHLPYPDAVFQIMKMAEDAFTRTDTLAKYLSGRKKDMAYEDSAER